MPKYDLNDFKQKVRGKSAGEVAEILKGLENVIDSEIKFTPGLPTILTRIPYLDRNIEIIVTPK